MNLRNVVRPQTWSDVAWEWGQQMTTSLEPSRELSWYLPPELLAEAVVYTPRCYHWLPCDKWLDPLKEGLAAHVSLRAKEQDDPDPKHSLEIFELELSGSRYPVVIDYSDYPEIEEEYARQALVYFKMQFREDGYRFDNVVPGGFVPCTSSLYSYAPFLRKLRADKRNRSDVYGRFGLSYAGDIRKRALEIMQSQTSFRFEGSPKLARYSRSMREAATSRLCLDLPGNGDFCFRLIDYLAIGACVIGPKHKSKLHVPLVDGEHIIYVKDDLSDLLELAEHYLKHEEKRERIAKSAAEFFDRFLHREQLAAYYLHTCFDRLGYVGKARARVA